MRPTRACLLGEPVIRYDVLYLGGRRRYVPRRQKGEAADNGKEDDKEYDDWRSGHANRRLRMRR